MERRSSVSGVRVSGPSIDCRCSIKLSTPPRLVARVKILVWFGSAIAAARSPLSSKESIPPKRLICRAPVRAADATGVPGNARATLRMRRETARRARVFAMRSHSAGKRLHPAMHQPAIERSRHRAADLLEANALEKFVPCRAINAPPITSLWPPKYFVVECMTRSAPSAKGRWMMGDQVLSKPKRAGLCAISATAARSVSFTVGLEGVSTQTSFVLRVTAFLSAPRSVISTKSTAAAKARKVHAGVAERHDTLRAERRRDRWGEPERQPWRPPGPRRKRQRPRRLR